MSDEVHWVKKDVAWLVDQLQQRTDRLHDELNHHIRAGNKKEIEFLEKEIDDLLTLATKVKKINEPNQTTNQ